MKKVLPLLITLFLLVSCGDGEHVCEFSEWHTLEAPTCLIEGREYRSCTCGKTESRAVAIVPHNTVSVAAKPATCSEGGYAAFEYCTGCSYTTFCGEIPPSHDTVTVSGKAPTCAEIGHEPYEYCTRCENYNTYAEIPAKGHSFEGPECTNCAAQLTSVSLPDGTATLSDGVEAMYYVTECGFALLDIVGSGAIPDFDFSPFSDLSPTHLRIGEGITGIGENAFSGMSTLLSVTVGSSVEYISDGAFSDCYRITEVVNLSKISISRDNANGGLGKYASYITASVATRVKFIDDFVFYIDGSNYTLVSYVGTDAHLTLPVLDGVAGYVVRNYAFYDLDFLLSVEYGEQVLHVGAYAFYGCDNLM